MSIKPVYLWISLVVCAFGALFSQALLPEKMWVCYGLTILSAAALVVLFLQARKSMNKRNMAFGLQSFTTIILVISILAVVNFLASKHPFKKDFTALKLHTVSDQTEKLMKGLKEPLQATLFGELADKEKAGPLMSNYMDLSNQLKYEFVNVQKEISRTKLAGIKKPGTLQLLYKGKEAKVDDVSEEKITNALIKLLKDKTVTVCTLTGHGEKSFTSRDPEGYDAIRQLLVEQTYEVKDLNLIQDGNIPTGCSSIVITGANRALLDKEKTTLSDYMKNGGRVVIAIDPNVKGSEQSQDILKLLEPWKVTSKHALVVDPTSKMYQLDASTPVAMTFNRAHIIVKDFGEQKGVLFPITRALTIPSGNGDGLTFNWLVQTSPNAWAETDLAALAHGQAKYDEGQDQKGPLNLAVAVEGKLASAKAAQNTRIVVFGSSLFAANAFYRVNLNQDLFVNSVSWVMDDENLISIRKREDDPGKFEIDQKHGQAIGLVSVLVLPALIAIAGIAIWIFRRKL